MRVLQVHKDFEPFKGGGGTARHIHGLGTALSRLDCEVRVVSPAPAEAGGPYTTIAAGTYELAQHMAWADVVHVHGARSTYCLAGAIQAHIASKPFFYTPHAYYRGVTPANKAVKWVWDRTAEAFIVGRSAATILLTPIWRDVLKQQGIPTERTVIIPNCVMLADLPAPQPRDGATRLRGKPAILSVGRLDPVKRIADVIRALTTAHLSDAHFHVVGEGAEKRALQDLAFNLGVASRVTFYGFASDAAVAGMVAGSDVFVLASEQEGLPTVLLEMLVARLPVVCSRIPGNLAIMDAANLGTTFDVGDVDTLSRQLAVAQDLTVPDAAVRAISRSFSWEERAGDVLDCYARSLGEYRAAA